MKMRVEVSLRRSAMLVALLLMVATATGCGVALPTQPDLGQPTGSDLQPFAMSSLDPGTILELADPSGGGGETGDPKSAPPDTSDASTLPEPGPGNSDWGHGHKN